MLKLSKVTVLEQINIILNSLWQASADNILGSDWLFNLKKYRAFKVERLVYIPYGSI